jgi:adenylate cyclase class IV
VARNIEIKARIASVATLGERAATFADEGPIEIHQDDTFFRCDMGRLS